MKNFFKFLAFCILVAITIFSVIIGTNAQSVNAPPLPANVPIDGKVFFPVGFKGLNYKVPGNRLGGSGINPDSINLQYACIRGNQTNVPIVTSGFQTGFTPFPIGLNLFSNTVAAGGSGDQNLTYAVRDGGRHVFQHYGTNFGTPIAEFKTGPVIGQPAEANNQFITLGQFLDSVRVFLPNGIPSILSLTDNAIASFQGSDRGGRVVIDNLTQPFINDPIFRVTYQYPYPTDAVVVLTGRDSFDYVILSDNRFFFEAKLIGTIPNASNFKVNYLVSGW